MNNEPSNKAFICSMEMRLAMIECALASVRETLGEVQEDMVAVSLAVDKDAETLIRTNRRLAKLSRDRKVA
jgi:uncharacterized coiled-coil protein SlyX